MPGSRLGDGCILGAGTPVPAGAVIPPSTVLVGRPPHAIRSATEADRERLAVLRELQTDLTDFPGQLVLKGGPLRFTRLRSLVPGVTSQVPTDSLRELEPDGMVVRHERAAAPAHVEYSLSELGATLCEPARAIRASAERERPGCPRGASARRRQPGPVSRDDNPWGQAASRSGVTISGAMASDFRGSNAAALDVLTGDVG